MRTSLGLCDYDVVVVLGALFSRDAATLYERVSVRPLVGRSVGPSVGYAFVYWPTRSDLCRVFGLV